MEDIQDKKSQKKESYLENSALATTHYIGSIYSLVLHSIFFVGIFALQWLGFRFDQIMLILTTVVSLEAIYLAIFIQMTVNHQASRLAEVSEDVEEISEDIDNIHEDVEDISEEMEDLGKEIGKGDQELALKHQNDQEKIYHIENILKELLREVRDLKDKK
jgi:uncharacterized protein YoxC